MEWVTRDQKIFVWENQPFLDKKNALQIITLMIKILFN